MIEERRFPTSLFINREVPALHRNTFHWFWKFCSLMRQMFLLRMTVLLVVLFIFIMLYVLEVS